MGQWFQRLFAGAKAGAVNAATIQGYLRAASQIEEVWQQIDDKVDELIGQGLPPWEAYVRMGYALAFVRACRMNVVFVQELLKAEAAANPTNAGALARITSEQALALCEHIEPYIEEALKAAMNPQYTLTAYKLPLELGPHIGDAYQRIPPSHLQGIIGAAQEMRTWTAGLLAKYELALHAAKIALPAQVTTHVEKMKSELELGDFHLRTGIDMLGQISLGQSTDELNARAEGFLWEAMESFYTVSQLVALSAVPARPTRQAPVAPRQGYAPVPQPRPAPVAPPAESVQPRPAPVPDTSQLFNQVIASPGAAHKTPAQPAENVSQSFDQIVASPGAAQKASAQPVEDSSQLFKQVIAGAEHGQKMPDQSMPDAADLLKQVTASSGPRHEHTEEAPDLLQQVIDGSAANQSGVSSPGSKKKSTPGQREVAPRHLAEDTTQDLLSDICGEQ